MADPNDSLFSKISVDDELIQNTRNASQEFNNLKNNISSTDFSKVNSGVKDYNSATRDLNEALKETVDYLKDLKSQGDLWAKKTLEMAQAEAALAKGKDKLQDITAQVSSNQAKLNKQLEEGVEARRKVGEYLTKAERAQFNFNEALKSGVATQQDLDDLQGKAIKATETLQDFQEKSAILAKIINGEWEDGANNLDKQIARTAAIQALQNEQQQDIVNNRERELKTLNAMTTPLDKLRGTVNLIYNKLKETDLGKWAGGVIDKIGLGFAALFTRMLEFDKMLTNTAKQLGISVEGARNLAQVFEGASMRASSINSNANMLVSNIKNQFEAQNQINEAFGTAVMLTDKERIDLVVITKQLGLQAEEAAKIYKLHILSGKSVDDILHTVSDQVIRARSLYGVNLNLKQTMQEVAKVNDQIAIQYKNNPEAIAKAVVQVKALGLSMDQAASASEKMLDFAGSLQNELEAELLTGKAINLEQARYYALMGDTANAAKELMNNVGGIEEYQNLNVLQQKSLAQAVGMTREELSKTVREQELLKGTQYQTVEAMKEAAALAAREGKSQEFLNSLRQAGTSEELIRQATQISNQEKFQMAIEKLQETLANIMTGPFGKLIDGFGKLVSSATALKGILYTMAFVSGVKLAMGIKDLTTSFPGLIRGARLFAIQMKRGAIGSALTTALSGNLLAIFGGLAAAGVAVAAINSAIPGGDEGNANINTGAIGENVAARSAPTRESQNITIENKFTLNNRDLGYMATSTNVGTQRRFDS
jgi:hypothetical protein